MAGDAKTLAATVGGEDRGQRLDCFIAAAAKAADGGAASALSREAVKRAICEGRCRVDGETAGAPSMKLRAGARVELDLETGGGAISVEEGELAVLYEDRHIVVCDKPAGLTVHPCPSCPSGTLLQRLAARYPGILDMGGDRAGIVHRIDKDTSGLIVVALDEAARLALAADFAGRAIRKEYLALAAGVPAAEGAVDEPVGRDPARRVRMAVVPENRGGREAHTRYTRLWAAPGGEASLLRVRILTGRTHQIRVHMAHAGHPLLGDALYAAGSARGLAPRQMLHAWHMEFTHPIDGRPMAFTCPPPQDFRDCCLALGTPTRRLVVTGNPGSGKSTLTALLAARGVPTVSADALVAGYYAPGGEIAAFLGRALGGRMLAADGSVDRAALMAAFEADPDLRATVEKMAHQLVLGDIRDFYANQAAARAPLACAEIPLYFECGWHREGFDAAPLAIGVRAGLGTRSVRLAATRGWSEEKIGAIEGWQWPEERKMAACGLVVDNDGTPEDLARRVDGELMPGLDAMARREREDLAAGFAAMWGPLGNETGGAPAEGTAAAGAAGHGAGRAPRRPGIRKPVRPGRRSPGR